MGKPTNGGIKLHARSSTRGLFKLCECSSTTSSYICMQLDIENTKKYVGSFFFAWKADALLHLRRPSARTHLMLLVAMMQKPITPEVCTVFGSFVIVFCSWHSFTKVEHGHLY